MAQPIVLQLEIPESLEALSLPRGVDERLKKLLDRQDQGQELSSEEQLEAEGLVDLAELLSLLRLRARRLQGTGPE